MLKTLCLSGLVIFNLSSKLIKQVEEGNGYRRNAYIRQNNIRTYLIKVVDERNKNSLSSFIQNKTSFEDEPSFVSKSENTKTSNDVVSNYSEV